MIFSLMVAPSFYMPILLCSSVESFKEWSAYGAGVPLVLDQRQFFVQYYVPYLLAIQLYGQSDKKSNTKSRYTSEDNDGDYYKDSSSDGSSDSEFGKRTELFVAQRNGQYYKCDISLQMSRLFVHDKHNRMQEGFSNNDSETGNSQDLLFEYFDHDPPYSREPLTDKILDLTRHYPILKSLRKALSQRQIFKPIISVTGAGLSSSCTVNSILEDLFGSSSGFTHRPSEQFRIRGRSSGNHRINTPLCDFERFRHRHQGVTRFLGFDGVLEALEHVLQEEPLCLENDVVFRVIFCHFEKLRTPERDHIGRGEVDLEGLRAAVEARESLIRSNEMKLKHNGK
ncbi:uncharacterized protein HKW66_Vig0100400 [Vigna angularis]|uniref:Uncharacterized protein n=1 Tax=Phaseolus angularis TaxID=3914 RepID=A0A8T0KK59_PHAAN|nr:uncharacterized protein HKW66_Vig0100400 [Vigna angularis]